MARLGLETELIDRDVYKRTLARFREAGVVLPTFGELKDPSTIPAPIAERLAGIEPPTMEDTEKTLPELKARIAKTVEFLKTLKPAQIDGSEARPIELKLRTRTINFTGQAYLLHFAMPNFYFHVTTAYDILRQAGVDIGKRDFIGQPPA